MKYRDSFSNTSFVLFRADSKNPKFHLGISVVFIGIFSLFVFIFSSRNLIPSDIKNFFSFYAFLNFISLSIYNPIEINSARIFRISKNINDAKTYLLDLGINFIDGNKGFQGLAIGAPLSKIVLYSNNNIVSNVKMTTENMREN